MALIVDVIEVQDWEEARIGPPPAQVRAEIDGLQPFRQQRLPLLAIAASIAALAALAVTSILARRRAGHTPVRVGRVVPARAPPLSLACS